MRGNLPLTAHKSSLRKLLGAIGAQREKHKLCQIHIHWDSYYQRKIKTEQNYKCWRACGEMGTPAHHWQDCKMVEPPWRTAWWFLKKLKLELPYDPASQILDLDPKDWKQELPQYLKARDVCTCVHIHTAFFAVTNRWKLPQMSDKLRVACTYNGILLFSFHKEGNSGTGYVDGPWGHYAKWNKPNPKRQILCDSSSMRQIHRDRK